MKKNAMFLVTICALSMVSCLTAMDKTIKMPGSSVLQKRLDKIAMTHFAEKTNIISKLADKEERICSIAMIVACSIHDFFKYIKEAGTPEEMVSIEIGLINMNVPFIFEALLEDEPAALEELKQQGLYKPVK